MLRFFKELYLTMFTIFFRAGGAEWSSGVNAGKGVAGVTLIESAVLLSILSWMDMLTGTTSFLSFSKWVAVVAFLAICAANHYPLVILGHGVTFERAFSDLKNTRRIFLVASCVVGLLLVVTFFIYSASAHRRFLGINDSAA